MNRRSLLLSACAVLLLALAGCGEAHGAWVPVGEETPEEQGMSGGAFDTQCQAVCSVTNTGSGVCPYTSRGRGSTSFLKGCTKACTQAKEEAGAKIPPGCVIQTCEYSDC
ncbi:hypothetical protein [Stigmatella aurantiaca]|uniref:Lipoprotein n=1 Tax=Stigmatella aurantiaca (strain DW4/3-1) TaxID=378806 RepID=E3FIP0_STIAD|nr:hypothetical protein [Stigmatella aurantiaca]ADO75387.1 uncharacterized protein STAUR_7632 [Stigmatella aurantiaca DW4/3-1]